MGAFRWSEEAVAAFNKRAEEWRTNGKVITHQCIDVPEGAESKYGNKRTTVEGEKFASKKEAKRWLALQCIQRAGTINDLDRQVRFSLDINGQHICDYVADFVYRDKEGYVAEDCKGYRTEVYKLKKILMKAVLGIEVVET